MMSHMEMSGLIIKVEIDGIGMEPSMQRFAITYECIFMTRLGGEPNMLRCYWKIRLLCMFPRMKRWRLILDLVGS